MAHALYTQSGKSVQRLLVGKVSATSIFENKSQWDAAHSGSHRSQCKIMQISMGRCAPPIPLIISTQPHLQISKGENPTQSNSQWNWHIPNQIQHIQFRTKNSGKNINVPNHVFQNTSWTQHAPTSRNLSPQLNATKQVNALSFQMGCKWVVWCCMPVVNPRQYYAAICQLLVF